MLTSYREHELLAKVPQDGTTIGNTSLMRQLRWDENEYWEVRNRLVDKGILETGRGRGGSVRIIQAPAEDEEGVELDENASEDATGERERETDLYVPLKRVLEEKWVKDKRFESWIAQITAHQGARQTGGTWSRPDITIATVSTYPYVPGRHFDVVTFEVKPNWSIDVTAVYEALGHLRSATRAYVLLHIRDDEDSDVADRLTEINAEAKRHGVGVITFADCENYDTWNEVVEPVRGEPEPRKLNDFLAKQLTDSQRERLVRWFR